MLSISIVLCPKVEQPSRMIILPPDVPEPRNLIVDDVEPSDSLWQPQAMAAPDDGGAPGAPLGRSTTAPSGPSDETNSQVQEVLSSGIGVSTMLNRLKQRIQSLIPGRALGSKTGLTRVQDLPDSVKLEMAI
ncbi:hypothetical protein V8F06_007411 [Rhypophila decipiens]